MASLNKVLLMGNLTRDPALRYTPKGTAVADISLAINHVWRDPAGNKQEDVTFVDVTLWGKVAEIAQKYLAKGRPVFLEGRLSLETWDDKDGKKRTRLKVIGENLQFLPSGAPRGETAHDTHHQPHSHSSTTHQPQSLPPDEDDIPF